ncbi:MAG: SGNH/GDSL hydrolase family protein [Lachnospiraceae bacterium]|nr:SGNH/GDSL hydrolase family protein [Lachnospiraceae bacterium]
MRRTLLRVIGAAGIITFLCQPSGSVMAAEQPPVIEAPTTETPAVQSLTTLEASAMQTLMAEVPVVPVPVDETTLQLTTENTDNEMTLILNAQAELAALGLPLEKYHVIDILGDSLTEGVGARTPDKAYPVVLSKLTGAVVNNYGVSGSRITDIPEGWTNPGSFVDRMYAMDKSADLVIVFGGTNDFWFGDCPIGNRTDTRPNTFYGALNTMIPYLKGAHPNADIVFIVPYQQSKDADETHTYKRSTYSDFGTGTFKQYRNAMLDRCEYYGIPVLDLYADYELNLADNREALEAYGNFICDGCHLNDAGYNLLARKIYRFIMQDFSTYVPQYTEINDMVFETAALPGLIQDGSFVMPNGQVILSKTGFEVDPSMPLQQIYQNLIISAMY